MKRLLLPLLLLVVGIACDTSRRVTFIDPKAALADKAVLDIAELGKKYQGYDGAFLNRETTLEHVTEQNPFALTWEFFSTHRLKYVVLNPEAEWLTTFNVRVPSGSLLERAYLTQRDPDEQAHQYEIKDLKAERNSDGSAVFKFAYPKVQKGTLITEEYVIKQSNTFANPPLSHDIPLQFSIPCEKVSFKFLYPAWWSIRVKRLGEKRELPTETTEDKDAKKKILTFTAANVPAIEKEPYSPFFKEVSAYAEIMVTNLKMGNVYYNAPSDWTKFAEDFKYYVMDRDPKISQRVVKTADELARPCKSDLERLEAVVGYVQTNLEVGYTKGNFADVLAQKKGSAHQLTGLTLSLLGKVGITSRFILIHSGEDGYFDPEFASSEELYIPAVMAELGGKTYVVFPYLKQMPVDHLPEIYQGQKALAINGAGASELVTLPQGNLSRNATEERYDLTFEADGTVTVKEEKTLTGSAAYATRRALMDLKPEETDRLLKTLLTYTEGKVTFKKHAFLDQNDFKKPLVIQLEYTVDNLVTITPEEVVFNTGGLFAPSSKLKTKVSPKARQNPIRIHYDEQQRKKITLRFPSTWTLTTPLQDVTLENTFGSSAATYRSLPGELAVEQTLTLKHAFEPKEKIDELLRLTSRQSKLYVPNLIFKVR